MNESTTTSLTPDTHMGWASRLTEDVVDREPYVVWTGVHPGVQTSRLDDWTYEVARGGTESPAECHGGCGQYLGSYLTERPDGNDLWVFTPFGVKGDGHLYCEGCY